ncbi:alpha/beta fold hydrolase [candidate division WWE3 bacterium]|uniref:Alpha/beta fold hydrolase n=1 Tax=candidate division WWE3 bacterium TaxID=2053526 RepID=A0A955RQA2_UNCKA|nr:alpha/beta fold hydrolase [candidate division WWE3 bacterium]
MKKIFIQTPLNETGGTVDLAAYYWEGSQPKAVTLFHMMPATKESWFPLADKINAFGMHVLAIDLRGHGESTQGTTIDGKPLILNFSEFTDEDHQNSIYDVEQSVNFFISQGFTPNNIMLGGASIGANLTLRFLSRHPEVKKGFALSPGLDYRGIKTQTAVGKMQEDQHILLICAEDDAYSHHSISRLSTEGVVDKALKSYPSGGHGTELFESQPEILDFLTSWVTQ